MHELGLIYQVVKTVDEIKKEQSLCEVSSITLQIGEMSDVVPKYIEQAWLTAKENTPYENTALVVEVVKARAKCLDCGFEGSVKSFGFVCPECASQRLKIISGREFLIKEISAK